MADAGIVQSAFLAGSIAAGATMLGTLPALFARSLSARLQDTMLGFGAGIMLAAASFSLVLPALGTARAWVPATGAAACWRSAERRVRKECVRSCRSRWAPYH